MSFFNEFKAIREECHKPDERIARLRKLVRKPNRWTSIAHTMLGTELKQAGRYEEAREAFLAAGSLTQAAEICHQLGRDEEALKHLTRAKDKSVRLSPHGVLLEAEVRASLGERESVSRLLRLAYCRTPDDEKTAEIHGRIEAISERFSVPISPRL